MLENPTGEQRALQPLLPALLGQSGAGLGSCCKIHPESFTCLWHHPSSFPLLNSTNQTVRAERATETAAAQHPRQAPGANTEPSNSSNVGDTEPNPHRVSSVLSQPQMQVLSGGSRAVPAAVELSLAAAASSCQPPTPQQCQQSATATQLQKGPALAPWSCRGSQRGSQGALGPPFLPAQAPR